jgi:hypothetical protein
MWDGSLPAGWGASVVEGASVVRALVEAAATAFERPQAELSRPRAASAAKRASLACRTSGTILRERVDLRSTDGDAGRVDGRESLRHPRHGVGSPEGADRRHHLRKLV